MKLLNAKTLKIEEFFGSKIPKYAILSHRWETEEVTYQEVQDEQARSQKLGWAKIRKTCELALVEELEYVWVDTCCINKRDFSELTEAINSMFNWYARSEVCYAYLTDVDDDYALEKSLWFTRGWTLQELIAPINVKFFNSSWEFIGTRGILSEVIHQRTGITERVLRRLPADNVRIRQQLDAFPVAVRMSWASGRETTRDEDRSYSLLGLFGVNMPLLYGEGDRAFIRLQEEIIKQTNDLTLFAWTNDTKFDKWRNGTDIRGLLADSPDEFKLSKDLIWSRGIDTNPEFVMTNKGLRITARSMFLKFNRYSCSADSYFLSLGCHSSGETSRNELGIILEPYSGTHEECVFARRDNDGLVRHNELWTHTAWSTPKEIKKSFLIKKHIDTSHTSRAIGSKPPLTIQFDLGENVKLVKAVPLEEWNHVGCSFSTVRFDDFVGFVEVKVPHLLGKAEHFVVPCWTGPNGEFGIHLAKETGPRREIYEAAMGRDWEEMQRLCTMAEKADYVVHSYVHKIGKLTANDRTIDRTRSRRRVEVRHN